MISQDLLGILVLALVTLFFLLIGYKEKIFSILCTGLIFGYGLSIWKFSDSLRLAEAVIVIMGLILFFLGLLNLIEIAKRSVSLHIIINPVTDQSVEQLKSEIGMRIADITHYKLGVQRGSILNLTTFGKFIAMITALMYKVLGIKND